MLKVVSNLFSFKLIIRLMVKDFYSNKLFCLFPMLIGSCGGAKGGAGANASAAAAVNIQFIFF